MITAVSVVLHQGRSVDQTPGLKLADSIWIGTALLHEQHPDREGFSQEDIVVSVLNDRLSRATRRSITQHVNQHCVANRKPQPNRACILFALPDGTRRLYQTLDPTDKGRWGAPKHPAWETLPSQFAHLRLWYERWDQAATAASADPLLALVGTGKDIWADEHADQYVARLREAWNDRP